MADRDYTGLAPILYSCGFPCTPLLSSNHYWTKILCVCLCPATIICLRCVSKDNDLRFSRLRRNSQLMQERAAKPIGHTMEAVDRRQICHQSWDNLTISLHFFKHWWAQLIQPLLVQLKAGSFFVHEDRTVDCSARKCLRRVICQGEGRNISKHCLVTPGSNLLILGFKSVSIWFSFNLIPWPWHSVVGCNGKSAQEVLDRLCKDQQLPSRGSSITETNIYHHGSKACFILKVTTTRKDSVHIRIWEPTLE